MSLPHSAVNANLADFTCNIHQKKKKKNILKQIKCGFIESKYKPGLPGIPGGPLAPGAP